MIIYGSNEIPLDVPRTKAEKLAFFENSIHNTKNKISSETQQDQTKKLEFNEDAIYGNYIAPSRNKHIFSVLIENQDNTFYFSPEYNYGTDIINQQQQVVVINKAVLYWQDF